MTKKSMQSTRVMRRPFPEQHVLVEGVYGTDDHTLEYTPGKAGIPYQGVGVLKIEGVRLHFYRRISGGKLLVDGDVLGPITVEMKTKVNAPRMVITEQGQIFISEQISLTGKGSNTRDQYIQEVKESLVPKYEELLAQLAKK